jgi:MFS family permease
MERLANAAYPARAAAWSVVAILFLASILNTIDRSMLNFLVDPIRRDLGISDVQISLLQGLSFSLFYVSAGFPLGLIADRVSRVRLLMAGSFIWSAATVAAGLSPAYGWMFAARMLVGFGEATLGPCAMPLISDSFPPEARGRPISLHLLGGSIASGLSALLISWILRAAPAGALNFIPGAAGTAPWRLAFIAAGALGFFLVLSLAFQPEPRRRGVAVNGGQPFRLRPIAAYLSGNAAVFLPLYLGFAAFSLATWGMVNWSFAMLTRQYGLSAAAVSQGFGTNFVIAGAIGALLSGQIVDLKSFARHRGAKLAMLAGLPLCTMPAACATLATRSGVATLLVASMILVSPMVSIVMLRVLSEMMPNDMRGLSVSLLSFFGTMIGGVFGPLLVALCTEHLFADASKVGVSVLIVALPFLLISSACYLAARRALLKRLTYDNSLCRIMAIDRIETSITQRQDLHATGQ